MGYYMITNYAVAVQTDIGLVKRVNQDSVTVKVANTPCGEVVMAVLCDGMGGLSFGEVASAHVILEFDNWFNTSCVKVMRQNNFVDELKQSWERLIHRCNDKITEYGKKQHTNVGTTVTAMLIHNGKYYISNVGDGRAYELCGDGWIHQITRDQTFVAREVELGHMTAEQANNDPRKNVLLQCVGVNGSVQPDFFCGDIKPGGVYLLCSDGFRHEITKEEMYIGCYSNIQAYIHSQRQELQKIMKYQLSYLIELNKSRNEKDNITAVMITAI